MLDALYRGTKPEKWLLILCCSSSFVGLRPPHLGDLLSDLVRDAPFHLRLISEKEKYLQMNEEGGKDHG
jgi:hypothetical protein